MDETPQNNSPVAGLECPQCRSMRFCSGSRYLECQACGAYYPYIGRVPVMFRDAILDEGQEPDTATVLRLSGIFNLDSDPLDNLRLRRMFRVKIDLGDARIRTESAQFLDRVRNSGYDIATCATEPRQIVKSDTAAVPRYLWLLDYIPRVIPAGTAITANVRFRNVGSVTMFHKPPGEIRLCQYWFDERGKRMEALDVRTPLPLDIPPGQEITLPMTIKAPRAAGRARIQLTMVQEGLRFLHDDAKCIPVTLADGSAPALPEGWIRHESPARSYRDDHNRGRDLLADWLRARKVERPRVLEIGGNVHPVAAGLTDVELYNLDVDLLGLQVSSMIHRTGNQEIACLCADAEDLPFPPAYFDAIILFATLHHFPDPARLLSHLATRLKAGGFIGAFCEPVGHIDPAHVDAAFLAELRKGVNEQSFTAAEYDSIFRRARLSVEEAIIDFNSLKARLAPFG